jgi:hypothetical protein
MKLKISFVCFILVLVPISESFGQSHSPAGQVQALRGLHSLTLIVIVAWKDANRNDPTQDQVLATVTKRLRDAGIDVRPEMPGIEPNIALRFYYSYARVKEEIYSCSDLQLTEQVTHLRQPTATLWGTTWAYHVAQWGASHHVDDAIDSFLSDYKQANPDKRVATGRHPTNR